ncbi:MAG: radical SAM protein, partial [Bacteroidia bacterium]
MNTEELLQRALKSEWLSIEEGQFLFENAALNQLIWVADTLRKEKKNSDVVTWMIDRNVNTTNVCIANCKFCNFYRIPGHAESYITTLDEYRVKIEEMRRYGGDQLLLQGGHHPDLGIEFYENLFRELKSNFPDIKLHALGPPE